MAEPLALALNLFKEALMLNSELIIKKMDNVEETKSNNLKPYEIPRLDELGDLRALTLGGSPGIGDSGTEFCEKPGVGGPPGPC